MAHFCVLMSVHLVLIYLGALFLVFAEMKDDSILPWPDGQTYPYTSSEVIKNERKKRDSGKQPFL